MKKTYTSKKVTQHVSIHSEIREALHVVSWSKFWFKAPEKLVWSRLLAVTLRKLHDILEQESPPRLHSSTSASFSSCQRSWKALIYSEVRLLSIMDMWFCARELLLMINRRMCMWRKRCPEKLPRSQKNNFQAIEHSGTLEMKWAGTDVFSSLGFQLASQFLGGQHRKGEDGARRSLLASNL